MYKCEKHGELDSEWCEGCQEIKQCDCTRQTYTRFKDMIYDCEAGSRSITMRLYHCETCGDATHVEI